ncbi:hypothetical protein Bca101_057836 [Brassica carinata]
MTLNVSKQDIADILECAYKMGSSYLSLPQYNGQFKMRKPDSRHLVTNRMLEEVIAGVYTSQERMMDDNNERLDGIYYPLDGSIGWTNKCINDLKERLY